MACVYWKAKIQVLHVFVAVHIKVFSNRINNKFKIGINLIVGPTCNERTSGISGITARSLMNDESIIKVNRNSDIFEFKNL